MEVRLSRSFEERISAVDPCLSSPTVVLAVSSRGIVVEKSVLDSWAKGSFESPVHSLEYHFLKHGRGRTRLQYTFDALQFFSEYRQQTQWGRWNPAWYEAFRLKVDTRRGYFTPGGRILSFWDEHEKHQTAL